MKNYEKPMVMVNEGVAEGVYAASGAVECWTIDSKSEQKWNGSHHVFEFWVTHLKGYEHTTDGFTVTVKFNGAITDAYSSFEGGNTVGSNYIVVQGSSFGNGYNNGDRREMKIWAKAADQATTEALAVKSMTVTACDWTVNVQGGGANGV